MKNIIIFSGDLNFFCNSKNYDLSINMLKRSMVMLQQDFDSLDSGEYLHLQSDSATQTTKNKKEDPFYVLKSKNFPWKNPDSVSEVFFKF